MKYLKKVLIRKNKTLLQDNVCFRHSTIVKEFSHKSKEKQEKKLLFNQVSRLNNI